VAPLHVRESIDFHFRNKAVGEVDCLNGMIDDIQYSIFGMKEPDYVMKIMTRYGALLLSNN
jgi:hypothetical protein